uniref:TGF-beta family profile domain-containing protein n=1 Tax=Globodera rostochiensis TaxID=31243 RepID=A0A914I7Y0_GLORO
MDLVCRKYVLLIPRIHPPPPHSSSLFPSVQLSPCGDIHRREAEQCPPARREERRGGDASRALSQSPRRCLATPLLFPMAIPLCGHIITIKFSISKRRSTAFERRLHEEAAAHHHHPAPTATHPQQQRNSWYSIGTHEPVIITLSSSSAAALSLLLLSSLLLSVSMSMSSLRQKQQQQHSVIIYQPGWNNSLLQLTFAFIVQFVLFTPFTVNSHQCSTCGAFTEVKQIRQEQILKDLLKKLDLSSKPNITVDLTKLPPIAHSNPRVQAMLDHARHATHRRSAQPWKRMDRLGGEEEEPNYFPALYETEQEPMLQSSYIIAQPLPNWFGQVGALFKFSTTLRKNFVQSAKLNVPVRRPIDQLRYTTAPIRLNVFRRFANGTLSPAIVSKFIELETSIMPMAERVEVSISEDIVQQWVETRSDFGPNIGGELGPDFRRHAKPSTIALYVEALYDDENLVQHSPDERNGEKAMFLELELIPLKGGRSRRNLNMCRPGQNSTQKCCLYDLVIDFEKIGWGFVIAPKRYNAYICSGECSGFAVGANSATMTRQHAANAAKIDHYQCCHPKEYSGIMILFIKENSEVLAREVPNMVAKECGCA